MRVAVLLVALLLPRAFAAAASDPLATLRLAHPRLLFGDAELAAARAEAKSDPLRAEFHAYLLKTAAVQLTDPPIERVLIGPRLLEQSRKAEAHIITAAMAWRLSGERRFADFAIAEMRRAAAFRDWNPDHFLDVAEMAFALGIGYDWLYPVLSVDDRATIKRVLLEKALAWAEPAYRRAEPNRQSFPFVQGNLTNNWNQVCNGGFLIAALALADEEPAIARRVIAGLRETLPLAMKAYEPDGAYPEGPTYWGFGTRYTVYILDALGTALGNSLGLATLPAFDRTVQYRVHVVSPAGYAFNYADGRPNERMPADEIITWLGQHYGAPGAVAANRAWLAQLMREEPNPETFRFVALHAVWFPARSADRSAQAPRVAGPPLDARFDGPAQIATFRSAWQDDRALWAGFKAGSNDVNHAHLDLGSFVLEADGQRWAIDLGRDNYDLPGYWERDSVTSPRWQYYRLNNLGHNTLTPGARLQEPKANAPIIAYASTPERAFAIADLTAAYPGAGRSLRRGLAMLDRARVLVQDDLAGIAAGTSLTWRMHTTARASPHGERELRLRLNGRELRAEILAPADARFTTHATETKTSGDAANPDVTVIDVAVPAARATGDLRVAVLLTPVGEKWPTLPAPALVPLADWK